MKKIYSKAFAAVLISALSIFNVSCNDDEYGDGNVFQSSMGQCLTRGENTKSHAYNFNKMSFVADYNNDNATVDLTIVGMVLPDAGNSNGIGVPKMELKGLNWGYNSQGWKVIDMKNVSPEIQGMSVVPAFTRVYFCVADVIDGSGQYRPGIQYQFDVKYNNEDYHLVGCCMTGTTEATSPEGVTYCPEKDASVGEKPTYWLDYDFANSTVDIYLYNAKFLGRMPSLNLVFPDVPYETSNGSITLKCDALTPMFGQTPFPSFPISKLKGTMDFMTSTLSFDFVCNYSGSDYDVKIECKY